jgi:hypothetical protein
MELNGAFSNHFTSNKSLLTRLSELRRGLLDRALASPTQPRSAPARSISVLGTITLVLERSGRPMRTIEIHAAASELLGRPLVRSSVRGILSAHTLGGDRRFQPVRRGLYQLTA